MGRYAYRHFLGQLETILPLFFRNSTPVYRRANTDHNAWKCAITRSVTFNSECTVNRCPLEELTTLPIDSSWILGERTLRQESDKRGWEERGKA